MGRTRNFAAAIAVLASGCAMQGPPPPPPPPIALAPPANPLTLAAAQEAATTFGTNSLKPGAFLWVAAAQMPKTGETHMLISMSRQQGWIYRGGTMIGFTTLSTGVADHPTDPGRWPILDKQKFHRSNKYSNAPMPWMQRLDKWGRALHAGVVPGYPASHGCIRLPEPVARKLFTMTKIGETVDIEV